MNTARIMGHDFPRFDDEYREHWISVGLWGDRTLHDLFDETVAERVDQVAAARADPNTDDEDWARGQQAAPTEVR